MSAPARHPAIPPCSQRVSALAAGRTLAQPRRGGFVLAVVLWVLVAASAFGVIAALLGRGALDAARNRAGLTRAQWTAEGCVEQMRGAIDAALTRDHLPETALLAWLWLDDLVPATPVPGSPVLGSSAPAVPVPAGPTVPVDPARAGEDPLGFAAPVADVWSRCDVTLAPAGGRVDLNAADGADMERLLLAAGAPAADVPMLTDALLDWRDTDDTPGAAGAEAVWYAAAGAPVPRNGPLADPRELARVRAFDRLPPAVTEALAHAVGVEPGRLTLAHAAPAALATLPGFTPAVIAQTLAARARARRQHGLFGDILALSGQLAGRARDSVVAHAGAISARLAPVPDAWLLTARAGDPVLPSAVHAPASVADAATPRAPGPRSTGVTAVLELRLVRASDRAAVVRRRTWVE